MDHLNFHEILGMIGGFAKTPGGQEALSRLKPAFSPEEIDQIYAHCRSLQEITSIFGICPLEGIPSLKVIFQRLQVSGIVLDTPELLDVALFVEKLREIDTYFKKVKEKTQCTYPPVFERWGNIPDLYPLKKIIEGAIDATGYIKDHASDHLRKLRRRAKRQKNEIQIILNRMIHSRRLAEQLADQYLTIRNGRYVLPVKAGAKQAIQGIIHDQSQSRLTLFIEPIECVTLNNALSMTYQEIEREEEEIRRSLSAQVAERLSLLQRALEVVTDLDLIHARVLFMEKYGAAPVKLRDTPGCLLRQVRHPLLLIQKPREVVPIDLVIPEGKRIFILSGVNAGGKTVALKTFGVVVLMTKAALPIPSAQGGEIYPYQEVFTEIGDEQSIADDLSTFTAHIEHLKGILEKSTEKSLVLIDEIGAGTGMSEGAALALGILDILARRGATVMVTTHSELLKGYGAQHPLSMNISVAFDSEMMRPLYTLRYGIPGNSNAFEMAKRYGLPEKVLAAAQPYRTDQERMLTDLISELESLKITLEKERASVTDAKREIQSLREQFKGLCEEITHQKEEILKRFQAKWDNQVKKQRQTFQEFMKEIKDSSAEQGSSYHAFYSSMKGRFNRMTLQPFREVPTKDGVSVPSFSDETITVGNRVMVTTLGKTGHVLSIHSRQKSADILVKGIRMQIPLRDLKKCQEDSQGKRQSGQTFIGVDLSTEIKPELNVVGYRVQDALPELDKFIDTALVHRMREVTIIHGIGTGKLREAIHKYLSEHEGIKGFDDGDIRRGGRGITVVQLI